MKSQKTESVPEVSLPVCGVCEKAILPGLPVINKFLRAIIEKVEVKEDDADLNHYMCINTEKTGNQFSGWVGKNGELLNKRGEVIEIVPPTEQPAPNESA
jgi:hypothetical protein